MQAATEAAIEPAGDAFAEEKGNGGDEAEQPLSPESQGAEIMPLHPPQPAMDTDAVAPGPDAPATGETRAGEAAPEIIEDQAPPRPKRQGWWNKIIGC